MWILLSVSISFIDFIFFLHFHFSMNNICTSISKYEPTKLLFFLKIDMLILGDIFTGICMWLGHISAFIMIRFFCAYNLYSYFSHCPFFHYAFAIDKARFYDDEKAFFCINAKGLYGTMPLTGGFIYTKKEVWQNEIAAACTKKASK